MKEYAVYVELGALVKIVTEGESAEQAEREIQNLIDEGTFDSLYESDIGEQLYYGKFAHHVCTDLTEEVE